MSWVMANNLRGKIARVVKGIFSIPGKGFGASKRSPSYLQKPTVTFGERLARLAAGLASIRRMLVASRAVLIVAVVVSMAVISAYAATAYWRNAQIRAESVAMVNGTAITKADIEAEARADGADPTQLNAAATKQLISRVADRRLLVEVAGRQGVAVDPRYKSDRARADEMFLAGVVMQRIAGASPEVSEAEGRQFMAAHRAMFADRQTFVIDAIICAATDLPASFKNRLNSLAQAEAYMRAAKLPVHRRQQVLDSAKLPPPVAVALGTLAPDKVFIIPQGRNILVGTVLKIIPNQLPQDVLLTAARDAAGQQQVKLRLEHALADLKSKAKISYQH